MWPRKIKAERSTAEARTPHGPIARSGDQPSQSLKTGPKSSATEPAPNNSQDYRAGDTSFQQRLKVADMQGMTLREFETALPEG
jgi:hypothetical protein